MTESDPSSTRELLRRTRPWWLIPLVLIFGLAIVLALGDIAPLRNLAYTVF
jgi:hypothetical protein